MKSSKSFRNISLIALIVIARFALPKLLSSHRPIPEPEDRDSETAYPVKCPSGNILHVEFDGVPDGQPLVFIHGLNSNSSQWYYQRLFFENRYRLIFVDMPGHGRSAMPKDLSIAAIGEDLAYILNYFGIRDPILYGHSMGAMVVMQYCITHPETSVKGIILQHSTHTNVLSTNSMSGVLVPLQNSMVIPFLQFSLKNYYLIWLISVFNHLNGLGLLFYRYLYFTGRQTSSQISFKSRIAVFTSPKTVAWALLELIKLNLTNDLHKINAPTLVLAAQKDRLTTTDTNEFISSQISGSQIKYVRTGHLSMMENFIEVNGTVNRFISRLR